MNFKHSGSLGDVIYSLPSLRYLAKSLPATLLLQTNVIGTHSGAHPAGCFWMNSEMANALIPLLQTQPYLDNVKLYEDEDIDIDLDVFRKVLINFSGFSLPWLYALALKVHPNLEEPWLALKPLQSTRVVISRTLRYQNGQIDWKILAPYRPLFIGLEEEYVAFNKLLPCDFQPTRNLLDAARWIAGSKFFIGNQSVLFAIAEALKVPRILEVCAQCPNVVGTGGDFWPVINSGGLKWALEQLS